MGSTWEKEWGVVSLRHGEQKAQERRRPTHRSAQLDASSCLLTARTRAMLCVTAGPGSTGANCMPVSQCRGVPNRIPTAPVLESCFWQASTDKTTAVATNRAMTTTKAMDDLTKSRDRVTVRKTTSAATSTRAMRSLAKSALVGTAKWDTSTVVGGGRREEGS